MDENYIRRERQRKQETKRKVDEMKAGLKDCTMDDVRMHKLPFDRALLIGLEEKGYFITAMFIQQLIDFQTEMTEKAGPTSILWTKPQLKDTKNLLRTISNNLMKAEEYRKIDDFGKECDTFLKVSIFVAFSHADWWWLGEQLLLQSISLSRDYPCLEGKYEALSRYAYARFLIENLKEVETALEYLNVVRELSDGKKWMANVIFPEEKDYLVTRTSYQLYVCLLQQARTYVKVDCIKTIQLATEARKRASEACCLEGETQAWMLKGVCEVALKLAQAAIISFGKACYIYERLHNIEGVCEVKMLLAKAYLLNGDTLQSLKCLLTARDLAEEFELKYYLAGSYRYLGEFYLNNGEPRRATPLLGEALKILHETNNIYESEQVRNLEAISTGLELFPRYLKLLAQTGGREKGGHSLLKMIDWKDSRKQFWSKQSDDDLAPQGTEMVLRDLHEVIEGASRVSARLLEKGSKYERDKEIVELHVNIDAFRDESYHEMDEEEQMAVVEPYDQSTEHTEPTDRTEEEEEEGEEEELMGEEEEEEEEPKGSLASEIESSEGPTTERDEVQD